MQKQIIIIFIFALLASCGSRKRNITKKPVDTSKKETVKTIEDSPETEPTKPRVINSTTDYIDVFKDIAINEMRSSKIPASITLAQGILESGSGKGRLSVEANNHFGIKCHGWKGKKIYHDDDAKQECFRKYDNAKYSFKDHSDFLKRKRYAGLFNLDIDDYKGWARGLRKAGYATDKKYPQKLISLIERYNLTQYDEVVIKSFTKQKTVAKKEIKKTKQHTVIKGDTLYSISRRYNLSVKELQQLNSIKGTELSIGQILNLK